MTRIEEIRQKLEFAPPGAVTRYDYFKDVPYLLARIEKLEKALNFYADWSMECSDDQGETACEALAEETVEK